MSAEQWVFGILMTFAIGSIVYLNIRSRHSSDSDVKPSTKK